MDEWIPKLRIVDDRPLPPDGRGLVFRAEDDTGPLEVCVSLHVWEALRTEAPLPCGAEDMRDYALGMIEVRAAELEPSITAARVRTVLVAEATTRR